MTSGTIRLNREEVQTLLESCRIEDGGRLKQKLKNMLFTMDASASLKGCKTKNGKRNNENTY